MKKLVFVSMIMALLAFAPLANASLTNNGGGLIYDSDLKITWYDFTYVNPTSGGATWQQAMDWASALIVEGVSGWRLPTTTSTVYGSQTASGGEMGHLYYAGLGLDYQDSISSDHTYFSHIKDYYYWTGVDYPGSTTVAFTYDFDSGLEWDNNKASQLLALAVHDGNVGAPSTVPIPAAVWLFGSGLLGLFGVRRKIAK